jgi:hypothetical protein
MCTPPGFGSKPRNGIFHQLRYTFVVAAAATTAAIGSSGFSFISLLCSTMN